MGEPWVPQGEGIFDFATLRSSVSVAALTSVIAVVMNIVSLPTSTRRGRGGGRGEGGLFGGEEGEICWWLCDSSSDFVRLLEPMTALGDFRGFLGEPETGLDTTSILGEFVSLVDLLVSSFFTLELLELFLCCDSDLDTT